MKCPRCNTSVLDERERTGVTLDVCPQCRGVWLDRGELEKLLAYAKRELEEERTYYGSHDREPPSSDRRGYGQERAQSPQHRDTRQGHGSYRKKSWLENLGEIFD
ncbi:MAG TPA: zf-TFIIB domain-containing protein [Polyangiaceae bacterium]|nr:zf-TFIIB domain-containing protein [Polyangiaceae bacterium]